jgi:hypothetical protein
MPSTAYPSGQTVMPNSRSAPVSTNSGGCATTLSASKRVSVSASDTAPIRGKILKARTRMLSPSPRTADEQRYHPGDRAGQTSHRVTPHERVHVPSPRRQSRLACPHKRSPELTQVPKDTSARPRTAREGSAGPIVSARLPNRREDRAVAQPRRADRHICNTEPECNRRAGRCGAIACVDVLCQLPSAIADVGLRSSAARSALRAAPLGDGSAGHPLGGG